MQLQVHNPYDRSLIGELPLASEEEVSAAIGRATEAKTLPVAQRLEVLARAEELLRERFEEFVETAVCEGGKPWGDSEIEVQRALQGIAAAQRELHTRAGEMVPMPGLGRLAFTVPEPAGVVLAYSAFNHPLNMVIHQVIPAVASGCPVVVKPATTTPFSCQKLVELLHEAGMPEAHCQMVMCDNAVAEKMVSDPRIAFFSFIGSAAVGWRLRQKLAPGVRCSLEHGGAAPVVVLEHADEAPMIPLLTKGGFYHAGQVCVSVQRVFAPKPMAHNIAEQLAEQAAKLTVGDPLDRATEVGPMIRPAGVDRMESLVRDACGAVLTGGIRLSETTFAPTVILDPPDTALISCEEIFGPIVCVYSSPDKEDAIRRANALPFSFQAALFGTHIDEVIDVASRLQADAVMVNDHTAFRVDWMPFGGSLESGLGHGGIPYAMRDMTREKLVVVRSDAL